MIANAPANWPKVKLNRWQQLMTAEQFAALPPLYSQDGKGSAATAIVKFFAGGLTWFASEFDRETGTFFGYVVNHRELDKSEWGYFTAAEICAAQTPTVNRGPLNSFRIIPVVERDLSFRPCTIAAAVLAAGGLDLASLDALSDEIDSDLEEADNAAAAEQAAADEAARAEFDALYADTAATVIARQEARDAAGLDPSQF